MKIKFKNKKKIIILVMIMIAVLSTVGFGLARNGYFGGGDTIPEDTMTRGLVASYDFDEGSGQVAYNAAATGQVNDGTLGSSVGADSADPKWTSDTCGVSDTSQGTALRFDGEDDYVDCGSDSSLDITDAITIEAWVKPSDWGASWRTIAAKEYYTDSWQFYTRMDNGELRFYVTTVSGTGSATKTGIMQANQWQQVVATYDGAKVKIYHNGIFQDDGDCTGNIDINANNDVLIGKSRVANTHFNGSIDGVKIYNRALSAEEVRYHYNRGGPVAHWSFDSGSGSVAYDATESHNHGTLKSSALDFDGSNDYVDTNSTFQTTFRDSFTIEMWVKPTDGQPVAIEVFAGTKNATLQDSVNFVLLDSGKIKLFYKSNNIGKGADTASAVFSDGQQDWHHIVTVADSAIGGVGGLKLYFDGVEQTLDGTNNGDTSGITFADWTSADELFISARDKNGSSENWFDGAIDEVRIYNAALSAEEIARHYEGDFSQDPTGNLVMFHQFEEGMTCDAIDESGCLTDDSSGGLNNGTLKGFDNLTAWDNGTDGWITDGKGYDDDNLWATGKYGSAVDFSANNWFDMGDVYNGIKTVSFWIKANNTTQDIIDMNGSAYIHSSSGTITATGFTSPTIYVDCKAGLTTIDTKWHYVTVTTATGINASDMDIGRREGSSSGTFDGIVDDVRIYNYARSADEIRLDYNAGFATRFGGLLGLSESDSDNCFADPAACMDYGLVGHWNMDEAGGDTLYDQSDNGNDGTLGSGVGADSSDPKWTSGGPAHNPSGSVAGGALRFDGENDYVDCGSDPSLNITDAITIEAWVKQSVVESWATVVTKGTTPTWSASNYVMGLRSGKPDFRWNGKGSVLADDALLVNTWYHLMFVAEAGTTNALKIYVDGVLVKQGNRSGDPTTNPNFLRIGSDNGTLDNVNGLIDEVRIYNRALSAEEVRYHYNRGGPVAHWKFDEGSGESAQDSSGNNNDGTLKSSALDFDGIDDHVNMGDVTMLDGATTFTISVWVKFVSMAERDGLVRKLSAGKQSFALVINGTDELKIWINDDTGVHLLSIVTSDANLVTGVWYNLVAVWDGGNDVRLYRNAVLLGETPIATGNPSVVANVTEELGIGAKLDDGVASEFLDGVMDEVRIYNKALHATTIANHYKGDYETYEKTAGDVDLTSDDLVFYIPFDDESGDIATNYGYCGGVPANCNGDLDGYTTAEQVAKYGDSHTTGWVIDTDWSAARQNTGLEFGGVNGFFQSDDYIASASAFSHSLWFKSSDGAYSADEYLFAQGDDDPSVYIDTSGNIKVMADNALKITSTATVFDTKWHHLEITADGTNIRLYLDGVLDGSVAYAGSSDDVGISAGAHISRSGFFDGIIDDFKVYNYARSADEIRLDYNAGFAARFGGLAGLSESDSDNCSADPASCMDHRLVGHWNMDEAGGDTLYDQSDNGNDGTLGSGAGADSADPKWTGETPPVHGQAGSSGTALRFDGENDYINCGNDSSLNDITDAITIEAWVKPLGGSTATVIAKKNMGEDGGAYKFSYVIFLHGSKFYCAIGDGVSASNGGYSSVVALDTWHHLVFTLSLSSVKIYLNGDLDKTFNRTINPAYAAYDVWIGKGYSGTWKFEGTIDGVKIYNRALSAEEVRYHYNRGGPVAHWKFDEGEGAKAYDESGNRNHGTFGDGTCLPGAGKCPTWIEGKHSSALLFDGIDDYVNCGSDSSLDITDAITIEAWFKYPRQYPGSSGYQYLFHKNQWRFHLYDNKDTNEGKMYVYTYGLSDSFMYADDILPFDKWFHLAFTYNGASKKIYLNGVERVSENATGSINSNLSDDLLLGYTGFEGSIDDVKIYSYARSPLEILKDYNAGLAVHLK